jgi:Fe-S cluster assembly iron-binding protein IscA
LALDESTNSNDVITEADGIKVVFDKRLAGEIRDLEIYYSAKWYNRGLKAAGPMISSC